MPEPESQRQPVPRVDGDEIAVALAFLGFARECVVKKTEGLGDDALRRAVVPTGTNLLGLVQHLAASERFWFAHHVAGEPLPEPFDDDDFFSMTVPADRAAADVIADYRAAAARSDEIVRAVGDPGAPMARAVDGRTLPLRWALAHVTGETTRHAGHADILRELLDGTTGR